MGRAFVRAGQYGIGAAQLLIPHLKGILSGLSSAPGSAPPGAAGTPLTQEVIAQPKQDIVTAAYWAAQALAERQQVTDTDLSRVGLGSLVPTLHRLDSMAPQLSADLGYATKAMDALPAAAGLAAAGLAAPAKYLLFLMDSDELRATGGFLGNYAVVTVSQGKIVGGIQLHDIATLDCPGGSCPSNTVPSPFSWFTVSPNHFALRDSNLDPDFPASARFAQQLFRGEGGPAVNGVIAVTPALIEAILKVTGPITVDAFKKSVSATTLQDTIHYFHITNFGNDPALAAQYATSGHKAFDAEMGSVLLKKVGSLAGTQQNQVFNAIFHALGTRDMQMYFNDSKIEEALTALHYDGAVQAPAGDRLRVADTNVSATYANHDLKEKLADSITLGVDGTASHKLTITYTYPTVPHPYDNFWQGNFHLQDFVRVIVPQGATFISVNGCTPASTTQAGHSVFACEFLLNRAGTAVVTMQWKVPHAFSPGASAGQYHLLIQKQAGTSEQVSVQITPADNGQLLLPLPDPLKPAAKGAAAFQGSLTKDLEFTVGLAVK